MMNFEARHMPAVSVLIVTYNSLGFIDRCLEQLLTAPVGQIEIVVVDNCSPDRCADHIERTYPQVKLVRAEVNRGFAAGNNLGFAHCSAPLILMLNPDAFVESAQHVLDMAQWLSANEDVAAVGPRLVNADGTHQVGDAGWRVGLASLAVHMFFLQRAVPDLPSLYLTSPRLLERACVEVDWICGACMLVRRSVIERVGGLDETIFMYGEDVEWGARMRDSGMRLVYLPQIVVTHLQGATQKGEASLFYSTKWIDACLEGLRRSRTSAVVLAARGIMATGFFLRAVLYTFNGLIRRRPHAMPRGRHMWNYLRHVL